MGKLVCLFVAALAALAASQEPVRQTKPALIHPTTLQNQPEQNKSADSQQHDTHFEQTELNSRPQFSILTPSSPQPSHARESRDYPPPTRDIPAAHYDDTAPTPSAHDVTFTENDPQTEGRQQVSSSFRNIESCMPYRIRNTYTYKPELQILNS
jgi:hypothetical protein